MVTDKKDWNRQISRRRFLKLIGLGIGGAAMGGFTASILPKYARERTPTGYAPAGNASADITVDPSSGDTLRGGLRSASPGDTILLKNGVNRINDSIRFDTDNVTVKVANGATFVLDASNHNPSNPYGNSAIQYRTNGSTIDGVPGRFVLKNAGSMGINVKHSQDFTLRGITATNCDLTGINCGPGAKNGLIDWCASYGNFVSGNSDGFHLVGGRDRSKWPQHITLRYCLAHHNSDDGFDTIAGHHNTFENCIAYWNGYDVDGTASDSPGVGFKLSYGYDYSTKPAYGTAPPSDNVVKNCITWGNGNTGLMWGKGSGHKAVGFTAWNNARKRSAADIDLWNPDTGLLKDVLVTSTKSISPVQQENLMVKPASAWQMDIATDRYGNPINPGTFALPKNGSTIASNGVGAAAPRDTWVKKVLLQNACIE